VVTAAVAAPTPPAAGMATPASPLPPPPRQEEPEPEPKTKSSRKRPGDSVIFFDWDDTLLCTTYLNLRDAEDSKAPAPDVARHLQAIQHSARRLLEEAQRLGHVFIVTNSVEGWVEHSASQWMPELVPLLNKASIVALRGGKSGPRYAGEVNTWKVQAFRDEVLRLRQSGTDVGEIVALGDSDLEIEAARNVGESLQKKALVKTVKLKPMPTAEELAKQLQVVVQSFQRIAEKSHSLSISLERKCGARCQQ